MADFAVAADLATRLGRTFTTAETAQATAFLADVSAQMRAVMGRQITSATYTFEMPSSASSVIELPERPVTSVTSVTMDGVAIDDYTLVANTLQRVHGWQLLNGEPPYTGRVWQRSEFATRIPVLVTVVYVAGYVTTPADLKTVCLSAAARTFSNPAGVQSEKIDDYAVTFRSGQAAESAPFAPHEMAILNRYRKRAFTVPQ